MYAYKNMYIAIFHHIQITSYISNNVGFWIWHHIPCHNQVTMIKCIYIVISSQNLYHIPVISIFHIYIYIYIYYIYIYVYINIIYVYTYIHMYQVPTFPSHLHLGPPIAIPSHRSDVPPPPSGSVPLGPQCDTSTFFLGQ